jgi:serine/threonine protein kinase
MTVFSCFSCGHRLEAADDQAGKTGQCPHCGSPFQVPAGPELLQTVSHVSPAKPPTVRSDGTSSERSASAPVDIPGYEILGELGRGGMGVIYKARQLRPRRLVALKMILAGEHASADAHARFKSEAETVARLTHPHIVQIHEINEHHGRPYLTLEFVEGGNLAQKSSAGPLPFRATAVLMNQLAQAVHFAHTRGIIHRDLKPANILLAADDSGSTDSLGVAKIADFGLAKQVEGMVSMATGPRTQSGAILGTPAYMAPEQAGGSKSGRIGPATDVYALGAILYECLAGQPPFRADSMIDTLMKVATEEPVPPRRLRPDCPRDLETICLKCLEKDPNRRYASAEALAGDLQRYLDDKPIACRPPGRLERLRRGMRRRKELVYLAAGVLATLCVGLLISSLARFAPRQNESIVTEEKANPPAELPADLDLVPRDAFAFATVRVADLWSRQTIRDLGTLGAPALGFSAKELKELSDLQRDSGIGPGDIDRATVVAVDHDLGRAALVLALSKPYDPKRIQKILEKERGALQTEEIEGRTVYSPKQPIRLGFCAFSERVLVLGTLSSIHTLLEQRARRPPPGMLGDALGQAAQSHALVVGLHPSQEFFEDIEEPLSRSKLESLRALETASLLLDLPARPDEPLTGLSLDLALNFPDEARARPGLNETLEFLKHLMSTLESNDTPAELRPLIARLLDSLRAVNWRQQGRQVRLAVSLNWMDKDVHAFEAAIRKAAAPKAKPPR